MKCPACIKEGKRSRVYVGGTISTLAYSPPYYDEDGRLCQYDPNIHRTTYLCSEGHWWVETKKP